METLLPQARTTPRYLTLKILKGHRHVTSLCNATYVLYSHPNYYHFEAQREAYRNAIKISCMHGVMRKK